MNFKVRATTWLIKALTPKSNPRLSYSSRKKARKLTFEEFVFCSTLRIRHARGSLGRASPGRLLRSKIR